MLCSNCRIIEIYPESLNPTICENGHTLCEKCVLQAKEKRMLCEGRMFDSETKAWMGSQADEIHNWTSEMNREWSRHNEFLGSISSGSVNKDALPLSDECDEASMNLLYSRGEYQVGNRRDSIDGRQIPDAKWNQSRVWNDLYQRDLEHFPTISQRIASISPDHFASPSRIEDEPEIVKTNTRQNLVNQTIEEIRTKIMEQIFSSFENSKRSQSKPEECNHVKRFHSVGVSTESTPRLFPESFNFRLAEPSREGIVKLTETENDQNVFSRELQEYLLMRVDTSSIPQPKIPEIWEGKDAPPTNFRLQQFMETTAESVGDALPSSTPEDQQFLRLFREKLTSMPLANLEKIISSVYSGGDNLRYPQLVQPSQKASALTRADYVSCMSNSHRAHYSRLSSDPVSDHVPSPQFELITFRNLKVSEELQEVGIIDAGTLNIPRSPIICPISTCRRAFFVSDFTKHIAVDHTKVPFERVQPRQYKNFLLDPKLIQYGVSRCQVLLLVMDKIRNLGHEKFKDFIPILVMTTRVSLLEFCSSKEDRTDMQNFIMIWLTGIMPPQLPIFFNLTVWARSGHRPICHIVHSGRLYSVRNSQSPEMVRSSGQVLLLSENQVDLLTNRGRHMLELQIAVH